MDVLQSRKHPSGGFTLTVYKSTQSFLAAWRWRGGIKNTNFIYVTVFSTTVLTGRNLEDMNGMSGGAPLLQCQRSITAEPGRERLEDLEVRGGLSVYKNDKAALHEAIKR